MASIFLICPVRGVDEATQAMISAYVSGLEEAGHRVYWPARDTDQTDPNGIAICTANFEGIFNAEEVHVWHDPRSIGSIFDFGMVFALVQLSEPIKVVLANEVEPTAFKSFANVLIAVAEETA